MCNDVSYLLFTPPIVEMIEDDGTTIYEDMIESAPGTTAGGAVAATGTGGGQAEDMYSGLSDGEIEDVDAYSDISSDENFLDSLNDEQRMVCDVIAIAAMYMCHPANSMHFIS